jgi:hypothetical protein
MRLREWNYKLLDLANCAIRFAWMYVARRMHLPAYLTYLVLQSGWLVWYLLIAASIGLSVAMLLRWRHRQPV